jgi:2-polyprenyl-6-methoxyphenol hydroxylase-like FAD-dependent oxidoreductase
MFGFGQYNKKSAEEALSSSDSAVFGKSFWNHHFVNKLRDVALRHKNITCLQGVVQSLLEDKDDKVVGVKYTDGKERSVEKEIRVPLTFVCDGIWSGLRK